MSDARETRWHGLATDWDLLVIGGGVTGAAILLEASRRGLRALLVERGDFASGTSSRSSKLVHGGLRYLKEGKFGLTRESVRERESLLRGAPGLVEPVPFLMPHYRGRKPGRVALAFGLTAYDFFAGKRGHRYLRRAEALQAASLLAPEGLTGAHLFADATTDDARLVLRLLQEAEDAGGVALNYVAATSLVRRGTDVAGATLQDTIHGETLDVCARAVISATGVFADELRAGVGAAAKLRPLRGSHLLLPAAVLPLAQAIAFSHPADGRPVFAYPWLGATLVGTTDLDHGTPLREEPTIALEEMHYLLDALHHQFPAAGIGSQHVISTYAGVRAIVAGGRKEPSKETRDHVVWTEGGLITVTGGKLTTFRPMAMDALRAAAGRLREPIDLVLRPTFEPAPLPEAPQLDTAARQRLAGRYGKRAPSLLSAAKPGELGTIADTDTLWAELRWAARGETVVHLDDLLLRRTRLGLLCERGGEELLPRVRETCASELGWDDARWQREAEAYRTLWQTHYGVPA